MDEKAINEVVDNRRSFSDPVSGKIYYIAPPTADDVRGADWQYSKIYTKSIVDGITTTAEMLDILMRRGITGPEFEQRQRELANELGVRIEALRMATSIDDKQKLALEVATVREELFSWNQRMNGPMSNTCEQIADESRLEYLTSRVVQTKEGKRVWEDYSDYLKEKNQGFAVKARFEVMLYLQGLESDFLEKTPEARAIKEVEEEIQVKAKQAIEELEKAREAMATSAPVETEVQEPEAEDISTKPKRKKKSSE